MAFSATLAEQRGYLTDRRPRPRPRPLQPARAHRRQPVVHPRAAGRRRRPRSSRPGTGCCAPPYRGRSAPPLRQRRHRRRAGRRAARAPAGLRGASAPWRRRGHVRDPGGRRRQGGVAAAWRHGTRPVTPLGIVAALLAEVAADVDDPRLQRAAALAAGLSPIWRRGPRQSPRRWRHWRSAPGPTLGRGISSPRCCPATSRVRSSGCWWASAGPSGCWRSGCSPATPRSRWPRRSPPAARWSPASSTRGWRARAGVLRRLPRRPPRAGRGRAGRRR